MTEQCISYSRQQKALEELTELDSVVEEKKKELKKQEEINRFKERIDGIQTTREQSIEDIKQWCGNKTSNEKLHDIIEKHFALIAFLFTTIVDTVLLFSVGRIDGIVDTIAAIFLFVMMYIAILFVTMLYLHSFLDSLEHKSPSLINKIKEKTLSTDYMLNSNVIDCPIEIKKELLDRLDKGFVYLSVGFGNHHLYYYSETGYTEKGHSEKGYFGYVPNAFDNEYDYFKDQLTAYKLYKISDIITDRGVKQHDDE